MTGITMGDANGVGPEIVVRTAAAGKLPVDCVVYGDAPVIEHAARMFASDIKVTIVSSADEVEPGGASARAGFAEDCPVAALQDSRILRVVNSGKLKLEDIDTGKVDARAGAAAVDYVQKATEDALASTIDAIITLPINKAASRIKYPGFTGHTEFIQGLCGNPPVTMMLVSERLIVTHVSTHVSIAEAVGRVTKERVLEVIKLTDEAVRRLRPAARIAVAGLNPHAGEDGAFGLEDRDHILPAIEQAKSEGFDVYGPEPGDTVFFNTVHRNRFDAVVCMYHDQGHIPMKTLDFDGGVNVTLGLPIVRTSVDHGTAYDIAYQGIASTKSFELAIDTALRMS